MSRLDPEPQMLDLAQRLGLGRATAPVEAVLSHCPQRIDRWVADAGGVRDMAELEWLVAAYL